MYRLLPLLLFLLVCQVSLLEAQLHPSMASRKRLADSINAALNRGDTLVKLGGNIVEIADAVDGCDTLANGTLTVHLIGGQVYLRRKVRNIDTVKITAEHQLVDDLNAWLNTRWAMDVTSNSVFGALGWTCTNDSVTQKYYTRQTTDTAVSNEARLITGESTMLGRQYLITGSSLSGSSFLSFDKETPRFTRYISRNGDSATPTKRLLANGYVRIALPECDTFTVEWKASTQKYPHDCGVSTDTEKAQWLLYVNGLAVRDKYDGNTGSPTIGNDNFLEEHYNRDTVYWIASQDTLHDVEYGGFSIDSSGYLLFSLYHGTGGNYTKMQVCRLINPVIHAEYCEMSFCYGGHFEVDTTNGKLVYTAPSGGGCGDVCQKQSVFCLDFCDTVPRQIPSISGVIAASVSTFDDDWSYPSNMPGNPVAYPFITDYEAGRKGKWRPRSQYVYRAPVIGGTAMFSDTTERVYRDAGVFSMTQFVWDNQVLNDSTIWIRSATTTQLSPSGYPMEERDPLGIYSAAWFDESTGQPSIVAANSRYLFPRFTSFESETPNITGVAHSGKHSVLVDPSGSFVPIFLPMMVDSAVVNEGAVIDVWVKRTYHGSDTLPLSMTLYVPEFGLPTGGLPDTLPFYSVKRIAKTGEWTLYQAEMSAVVMNVGNTLLLRMKNITSSDTIWIDDLKIQPRFAESKCFVYDDMHRLAATLDDQHFGTYYQYNGEGKLVRTLRETERGLRTIEEHQYHLPMVLRDTIIFGKAGRGPDMYRGGIAEYRGGSPMDEELTQTGAWDSTKFSLLELDAGTDGARFKLLGSKRGIPPDSLLPALTSLADLSLPEVPDLRSYELLRRLDSLDKVIDKMESVRLDSTGLEAAAERTTIDTSLKDDLKAEREAILREVGMSEEEARSALNHIREVLGTSREGEP